MNTLTITQELDSTRNLFRNEKLPKPAAGDHGRPTAELENKAVASRVVQPGEIAPDLILPDVDVRSVRLYSELKRESVVLAFNRGGWCPHCRIHLRGYQNSLTDFKTRARRCWSFRCSCPTNPDELVVWHYEEI